jgi:hypothetical protein
MQLRYLAERHIAFQTEDNNLSLFVRKLCYRLIQSLSFFAAYNPVIRPIQVCAYGFSRIQLDWASPVSPDSVSGTIYHTGCQIAFEISAELEVLRGSCKGHENIVHYIFGSTGVIQQSHG